VENVAMRGEPKSLDAPLPKRDVVTARRSAVAPARLPFALAVVHRAAEIQAWLEPRADEMTALVARLVALDTENPPGRGLGTCGRVVRDAMEKLGLVAELIDLEPSDGLDEPCIVRGSAGTGGRTVYFHGHFDVVPAQDPAQLVPLLSDGRIVGRGTADMKGGLVSMLYGAAAVSELGLPDRGRIVLHFVCDEETGSARGARHLRRAGMIDAGAVAMLTAEPTGGAVWHASRGALTLRVEVRGREAHVGEAQLGVNAFEGMIRVAEPLARLSESMRAHGGSTLVVGGAAGSGAGFNVVPGSAWFSVDGRFGPDEDLEIRLARLTETIERAAADAGAEVSVEVVQREPAASTDASHPVAETLARCVAAVEGERPRFELCPGVLETRWYAQLGIPALAYGPGLLGVSHGPEEYVEEAAVRRCAAVYALAAAELLR
jgi:acetylornithine deacetylase/succinyl-diaminopimelate desuccinylase-like protein